MLSLNIIISVGSISGDTYAMVIKSEEQNNTSKPIIAKISTGNIKKLDMFLF